MSSVASASAPPPDPDQPERFSYSEHAAKLRDTRRRHAAALRRAGASVRQIAEELGVGHDTAWRDLQAAGEVTSDDWLRGLRGRERQRAADRLSTEGGVEVRGG